MPGGELNILLIAIGLGLLGGLLGSLPILIRRFFNKEPLFPKGTKPTSPRIFYVGIVLFGAACAGSLAKGWPLFGATFALFASMYVVGLVAFYRGWRS